MRLILLLLILLLTKIIKNDAAKLLVFGVSNSKSHMLSNGRIADTLAYDGHDVTFVSIENVVASKDFPTTKLSKVVYLGRIPEARLEADRKGEAEFVKKLYEPTGIFQSYFSMFSFSNSLIETFDVAFTEDKSTIEKLKSEKFDAIFYESLFPHGGLFGHLLGINLHFLITSSTISEYAARIFGIPAPSGWVPATGILSVSDKMTFWERAQNWLETEITAFAGDERCEIANSIFQKHFRPNFPRIQKIMKDKTAMIFTSVNEFIEFPRPMLHKIIYIGGLGMNTISSNATISPQFESEMEKGKNGVIFFSLGSNIDTAHLPKTVKKNLIDAFGTFIDYHFIVKFEKDDDYGIKYAKTKSNIFVTHWAPQYLILKHPNLKLFFTHGGYNSLLETAYCGKPILVMPMMNDQLRNAQAVQRNGWGKVLDKMDLLDGKDKLISMMEEMLDTEKYQKNAKRIKNLLETKPFSANELFLKNVKFVLENGGELPELQATGADMNIFVQFNIDIYLIAILTLFLIFASCIYIMALFAKVFKKLLLKKFKNKTKIN